MLLNSKVEGENAARLDEDPALFFLLRNVNVDDMVSEAIAQKSDELLNKEGRKSRRSIVSEDLSTMFSIELESGSQISLAAPVTRDIPAAITVR